MVLDQERAAASSNPKLLFNEGVELTTDSGLSFQVRGADQSDEAVLAEFFTHVTQDDLRFRFLSAIQEVGRPQIAFLTNVDHRRVENYLAFDMVTGCLLASAMLAIEDDLEHAEVAIVLRSDFKNRGIGWTLLKYAGEQATRMGVKTLQAIESRDNLSAINVERDLGFTSRPYPGDASLTLLTKSLAAAGADVVVSSAV